jgi:hypothetical protein
MRNLTPNYGELEKKVVQIYINEVSLTIALKANKFGHFQVSSWIAITWSRILKKDEHDFC